jgi:hypothetical protein
MNRFRGFVVMAVGSVALLGVPAASPRLRSEPEVRPIAATDSTPALGPALRGLSGNLRAVIGTPATLEGDEALKPLIAGLPIHEPGVHELVRAGADLEPLVIVTMAPLDALHRAPLDAYRVGSWPSRGLAARDPRYAAPPGFIPVTLENASTRVSKRFRLGDFLTHDQQQVWPKVLVLRVALLDKLELIGDRLASRGLSGALHVMSGFRTPQYNAAGVLPGSGRSGVSRHMYGDAADIFVDEDGDGRMDDLDGDGRITIQDARVLLAVADGVEASHPELAGGLSAYAGNSAHGPFVHVDARGTRARW